ncbi:MAG: NUDIX hydrolase [Candidatus Omnitrophica bacterium]|nr:NUDIX hydrolase [Candidatus Omnitrophota bacterium]
MKFQGKKFSFAVVKKKLPNGRYADVDVIEHPGAVVIVPFLSRDTVILLHQYRPVLGRYLLELPAGTLERDEQPLACARRELIEETDHKGSVFTRLGKIYPVPGYSTEVIHIFKAEKLTPQTGTKDMDEIIRTKPLRKSAVRKLFRCGGITDAKTIAALSLCGWLS